jgi:RHS repeat-associated protein
LKQQFWSLGKQKTIRKNHVNCYDYGARFYDAALGRFFTPDPLTDFFSGISPYNYAQDNPILNIDFEGLGPKDWINWIRKTVYKLFHQERKHEWVSRCRRVHNTHFRSPHQEKYDQNKRSYPDQTSQNQDNQNDDNSRTYDPIDPIESVGYPHIDVHLKVPDLDQIVDIPNIYENERRPIVRKTGQYEIDDRNVPTVKKSPYSVEANSKFLMDIYNISKTNPRIFRFVYGKQNKNSIYFKNGDIVIQTVMSSKDVLIFMEKTGIHWNASWYDDKIPDPLKE